MEIYDMMLQRNALHATLPLLSNGEKARVQMMVDRLDAAIAYAEAQETMFQ